MSETSLEKVLIIDDNSDYRKLIKTFINKLLPNVETIEYDPVFEGAPGDDFDWSKIDVLLLDYHLSIVGTTGLDILHKHHKKPTFPATIMLTGAGTEETAIRALDFGIYEYQPKQSLTKDKLKQSIIHAWEDKKSKRKKQQEITQHNKSFSKEVFYENLENTIKQNDINRSLVVIKPDNLDALEEQIGVIGRDNLVNHIGKNSFEVFKLGACNPNITKISDTEIAVQIDYPGSQETLAFNMQGLSKHLKKCTFKFAEEKYPFSVSIGALKIGVIQGTAEQMIHVALAAADKASETEGNSFYLWQETDEVPPLQTEIKTPANKPLSPPNDTANEEKEKLEQQLKEAAEAKKRAEQAILAEQQAKKKLEEELRAAAEANKKAEAELKAATEAKAKAEEEARLKAEEEAKAKAEEEARLKAEEEAKAKAEEEARLKAEEEAKHRMAAELKAEAEAKAKAEAEMQAAKEAREKAEAQLKAEEEAKQRREAELKAEQEAAAKAEAEMRAEQEAREKAEAKLKAEEEAKHRMEAELKAEKEAAAKAEAEMRAEQEAAAKAKAKAEMQAAKEAKEKLEAELKAVAEARAKAEAEMQAAKEAKEKLEAELKAAADSRQQQTEKPKEIPVKEKPETQEKVADENKAPEKKALEKEEPISDHEDAEQKQKAEQDNTDNEIVEKESALLETIEAQIRKLIDEKRILQTYQPVIAMFDGDSNDREIYKVGLQAAIEDGSSINENLADTSNYSTELQQLLNEWILRQVFLRITESGTADCKYQFIIKVTDFWFSEITLFNWLQKILGQTKKYAPGKAIILDVPMDIFNKHQKRAQALISTLHKSHHFSVALSNVDETKSLYESCRLISSNLLMVKVEQLQHLTEILGPENDADESDEETEKQNLLQFLKTKNIRIITSGIEDATLLTDAITAGTDYAIGGFVGEIQDSLVQSGSVESFELT